MKENEPLYTHVSRKMESSRKRKGFMKGKLMLLYRSSSNPSSNVQSYSSKVKPSQNSQTTASVGYVSFILPASDDNRRDKLSHFDKFFGVVGDARIDNKASSYIASVQERFKLERVNSDRKQLED
ncbi:DNA double-strand break repair ATPase [Salix suchowensis]|nr:DNA double-strand break repair ATPase [Salix suchowensis]